MALLPLLEKGFVKELQWRSGPMSCARGNITRKGKLRKETSEILWICGKGKDRAVEDMDPYDKLKSKFPARCSSKLLPPQGVLTMDTG